METTAATTPSGPEGASGNTAKKLRMEAPSGVRGRVRLEVDGKPAGILEAANGEAELRPDDGGPAEATIATTRQDEEHVRRMLRGRANPVVAMLQGRFTLQGDAALAAAIVLGIQGVAAPAVSNRPAENRGA